MCWNTLNTHCLCLAVLLLWVLNNGQCCLWLVCFDFSFATQKECVHVCSGRLRIFFTFFFFFFSNKTLLLITWGNAYHFFLSFFFFYIFLHVRKKFQLYIIIIILNPINILGIKYSHGILHTTQMKDQDEIKIKGNNYVNHFLPQSDLTSVYQPIVIKFWYVTQVQDYITLTQ